MKRVVYVGLLAAAFVSSTAALGWWTVPALAGVWGFAFPQAWRPGRTAALAAGFAWALLLSVRAWQGPVAELAGALGQTFGLPGLALIALTVAFPASLAWSGATLTSTLVLYLRRPEPDAA